MSLKQQGEERPEKKGSEAELKELIGERLLRARKLSGIRQSELAERLKVAPSTISNLEKGKSMVGVELLIRILKELDMGIDELMPELVKGREAVSGPALERLMELLSSYGESGRRKFLRDSGELLSCLLKLCPVKEEELRDKRK